jgi:hypothetical protein
MEDDCPVCLCPHDSGSATLAWCKHKFHRDCILTWFKDNNTCPMCRCDLSPSTVINVQIPGSPLAVRILYDAGTYQLVYNERSYVTMPLVHTDALCDAIRQHLGPGEYEFLESRIDNANPIRSSVVCSHSEILVRDAVRFYIRGIRRQFSGLYRDLCRRSKHDTLMVDNIRAGNTTTAKHVAFFMLNSC